MGQYDRAITAIKESIRLNPNDPDVYTLLASSYLWSWIEQESWDPQALEYAEKAAQQAVALSDSVDWTHGSLSWALLWRKQYEQALAEAERSVTLNPTEAQNLAHLGHVLNFTGHPDLARQKMAQVDCSTAFLTPNFCFSALGNAYYLEERYEEAVSAFQEALKHPTVWWGPRIVANLGLTASLSELGREKEAQAEISEILKINPQFSLEGVRQRWPYKDPADLDRFVTALRKAGLK